MDCITHTTASATIPLVIPRPLRRRREPVDLVAIIQVELGRDADPAHHDELLGIASAILKRRQSERTPRKGARR